MSHKIPENPNKSRTFWRAMLDEEGHYVYAIAL
jgi:hypothetical protein